MTTSSSNDTQATIGALTSHRVLSFDGTDAASFLQGYLTCDTDKLKSDTALPGAFTNLKGRVVANGWVWGEATQVQMLVVASLTEAVANFLKPYMNFSKTKLSVADESPTAILLNASKPVPNTIQIGSYGGLLTETSKQTLDLSPQWLERCIAVNEPVLSEATSGTYLPQMLGLTKMGAVSFDKGCYLGQEIVARAEHRGEVKRRLQRISYAAQIKPVPGAKLTDESGRVRATLICASTNAALIVSSEDLSGTQQWFAEDTPVAVDIATATLSAAR